MRIREFLKKGKSKRYVRADVLEQCIYDRRVIKKKRTRYRICCRITSSESKCCLKYKASANASAFLFQTKFLHLGGYYVTNACFISILPRQETRADRFPLQKNEVGLHLSVMSFLNKTAEKAVPCCTLVSLGMQAIGFLFEKKWVSFF